VETEAPIVSLLGHTKETIAKITEDFDSPNDDYDPVLLVRDHEDKVAFLGIGADMNDGDAKEEVAKFMFAVISVLRAKEAVFVSSTWMVKDLRDGDVEDGHLTVMPRDHPNRVEAVTLMHASLDGDAIHQAEIFRTQDKPPTIGEWNVMATGELQGRFGYALRDGLKVGRKLASDETPPEIVEFMNKAIADGDLEGLARSFMNAATKARERFEQDRRKDEEEE